jgi:hypothetical protein
MCDDRTQTEFRSVTGGIFVTNPLHLIFSVRTQVCLRRTGIHPLRLLHGEFMTFDLHPDVSGETSNDLLHRLMSYHSRNDSHFVSTRVNSLEGSPDLPSPLSPCAEDNL